MKMLFSADHDAPYPSFIYKLQSFISVCKFRPKINIALSFTKTYYRVISTGM